MKGKQIDFKKKRIKKQKIKKQKNRKKKAATHSDSRLFFFAFVFSVRIRDVFDFLNWDIL